MNLFNSNNIYLLKIYFTLSLSSHSSIALFFLFLSIFSPSELLNFYEQSGVQALALVDTVWFIKFCKLSWLNCIHKELVARDEVKLLVDEHDHFNVLPVPENLLSFLWLGANVWQSVGKVLELFARRVIINVAEVNITVSNGNKEVEVINKNFDGVFALKESGAQNWEVAISSVQESCHALLILGQRNVLEVVSN